MLRYLQAVGLPVSRGADLHVHTNLNTGSTTAISTSTSEGEPLHIEEQDWLRRSFRS